MDKSDSSSSDSDIEVYKSNITLVASSDTSDSDVLESPLDVIKSYLQKKKSQGAKNCKVERVTANKKTNSVANILSSSDSSDSDEVGKTGELIQYYLKKKKAKVLKTGKGSLYTKFDLKNGHTSKRKRKTKSNRNKFRKNPGEESFNSDRVLRPRSQRNIKECDSGSSDEFYFHNSQDEDELDFVNSESDYQPSVASDGSSSNSDEELIPRKKRKLSLDITMNTSMNKQNVISSSDSSDSSSRSSQKKNDLNSQNIPTTTRKVMNFNIKPDEVYCIPKIKYNQVLAMLDSPDSRYDKTPANYNCIKGHRYDCEKRRLATILSKRNKMHLESIPKIADKMRVCLQNEDWNQISQLICRTTSLWERNNRVSMSPIFLYGIVVLLHDPTTRNSEVIQNFLSTLSNDRFAEEKMSEIIRKFNFIPEDERIEIISECLDSYYNSDSES